MQHNLQRDSTPSLENSYAAKWWRPQNVRLLPKDEGTGVACTESTATRQCVTDLAPGVLQNVLTESSGMHWWRMMKYLHLCKQRG